jgi:predicted lipid-binding transport protein (Tim44 family)
MTVVGWVRQGCSLVKTIRWLAVIAAVIVMAPSLADARAGAGSSSGSRGSKTNQAPPPTETAPTAKPVERSATPQQPAPNPSMAAAPATPPAGGFMSRHPFMSGLMGGILGAGLFGMMFGGGFGGAAGMLGMLLQVLVIGGVAYLAVRLFRGWSAARVQPAGPARAYATAPGMTDAPMEQPLARSAGPLLVGGASAQLAITTEDYTAFESLLSEIQTAYGNGDLIRLRGVATPEMLGYFSEQLSGNASRGLENKVEAVKLEQGDLSEAWSEAGLDYATVAMRFSMIDVTRKIADGSIVEGSDRERTEAREVWTFLRSRGGKWILSAIQQT